MKPCPERREERLDLALGEPSPALEEHVRACAACAADVDSLRRKAGLLDRYTRALMAAGSPPHLASRVLARARSTGAHPREANRPRWRLAWAGAGLFVATVLMILVRTPAAVSPSELISLSRWESPTDFLLQTAESQLMRSAPRVGETYFDDASITKKMN